MTTDADLSPDQLASFDQAWAETAATLADLVRVHRAELDEHRWELSVAGLSHFLRENSEIASASQLLAAAVHLLATQEVTG